MSRPAFWSFLLVFLAHTVAAGNITILVGGTGFVFRPPNVTAAVGDLVNFIFLNASHSVTQSPFTSPCSLLQDPVNNVVGFDSGLMPVDPAAPEFPIWTLNVTDTKPIWFYCKQGRHCQAGMVGSINAPLEGSNTFEAFRALAMADTAPAPTTTLASPTSTGVFVSVGALGSIPASETTLAFTTATTTYDWNSPSAWSTDSTSTYYNGGNYDGGIGNYDGGSNKDNGGTGAAPIVVKASIATVGVAVGAVVLFNKLFVRL